MRFFLASILLASLAACGTSHGDGTGDLGSTHDLGGGGSDLGGGGSDLGGGGSDLGGGGSDLGGGGSDGGGDSDLGGGGSDGGGGGSDGGGGSSDGGGGSSDGGGSLMTECVASCDRAMGCLGLDACGLVGVDCTNPCHQACLAAAMSCTDYMPGGSAQMCLSACGGATDAGVTDSGSTADCQSCVISMCGGPGATCIGDATCMSWAGCLAGATTPAEARACDTMFSSAATLYSPVYTCACTSCPTDCAAIDPCAAVP